MPKVLLEFIELLSHHNYLSLPEANSIIYYIVQLSEPDPVRHKNGLWIREVRGVTCLKASSAPRRD